MKKPKKAKSSPDTVTLKLDCPVMINPPSTPPVFLRPKKAYLWDTETLVSGKERLGFFERPFSCAMEWTRDRKTEFDTNMTQAGQLRQPERFLLFGVHLSTCGATPSDLKRLLFNGRLNFYFIGRRTYFSSMLSNLVVAQRNPSAWKGCLLKFTKQNNILVDHDGKIVEKVKKARSGVGGGFINCCDVVAKKHQKEKLSVGRNTYQIGPSESFSWEIAWPKPQVLVKPVTFRVAMYGILFEPI